MASAERPAAAFSATQVKFWTVPGLEGVHSSSARRTKKWVPRGKPPLNSQRTLQSMSTLQLAAQVKTLSLPGTVTPGPRMLTLHGSTMEGGSVGVRAGAPPASAGDYSQLRRNARLNTPVRPGATASQL